MVRKKSSLPTDAELEILKVLWKNGPSSVAEVHEVLSRFRKLGYTTVLKFLQIMFEKGLVTRDESQRAHVYEAAFSEEKTQYKIVRDLLKRVFGGASHKLVMQALTEKPAPPKELAEIRKLIDKLEKKGK